MKNYAEIYAYVGDINAESVRRAEEICARAQRDGGPLPPADRGMFAMAEAMAAVRRVMPDIQFARAPYSSPSMTIHMFAEGDILTRGYMCWGDMNSTSEEARPHRYDDNANKRFVLVAPGIVNKGAGRDADGHYVCRKSTSQLAQHVKNVLRYIRPVSADAIHAYCSNKVDMVVFKYMSQAEQAVRDLRDRLLGSEVVHTDDAPLVIQLRRSIQNGLPIPKEYGAELLAALDEAADATRGRRVVHNMLCVHATSSRQYGDAVAVTPRGFRANGTPFNWPSNTTVYRADTLPEGIADKIAVLSVNTAGVIIPEIGVRPLPEVFYVYE